MSLDIKRLLVPERNEMSFDVKERLTAAHKKEKLSAVNLQELVHHLTIELLVPRFDA